MELEDNPVPEPVAHLEEVPWQLIESWLQVEVKAVGATVF